MSRRLDDLAEILEGNDSDTEGVRRWRRDWRKLAAECERIQNAIDTEIENSRLYLRPGITSADTDLSRARGAATVAEGTMDHLRSLTRTLDYALDSGEIQYLPASFRTASSSLLRRAGTTMQEIGQTSHTDSGRLDGLIDDATAELDRVEQQERAAAEATPTVHTLQGTLLTDIGRLLAELRSGHKALTS
ncbi:hypothetical protein ACFRSX_37220 [Streptomyces goshikiensis]|uniref:hypothetical protein n=2 Tax=Streptomyces TaxID=1883 RepID=UPI000C274EC3|nr:hypothetical protein [Streptomyces sp. CB02120-2]PJN18283.1 hypothetical protein CG724_11585 [Streptomyces sp. CB02120-2]